MTRPMRLQTLAVHGGEEPQDHLGALSTPLYHASVYAFPSAAEGADITKVGDRATSTAASEIQRRRQPRQRSRRSREARPRCSPRPEWRRCRPRCSLSSALATMSVVAR